MFIIFLVARKYYRRHVTNIPREDMITSETATQETITTDTLMRNNTTYGTLEQGAAALGNGHVISRRSAEESPMGGADTGQLITDSSSDFGDLDYGPIVSPSRMVEAVDLVRQGAPVAAVADAGTDVGDVHDKGVCGDTGPDRQAPSSAIIHYHSESPPKHDVSECNGSASQGQPSSEEADGTAVSPHTTQQQVEESQVTVELPKSSEV